MSVRRTSRLAGVVLAGTTLTAVPADAVPELQLEFSDGVLTLKLQGGDDDLRVTRTVNKIKVRLNGGNLSLSPRPTVSTLQRIVIDGRGGDDTLVVDPDIAAEATIDGGGGDDVLAGGKGWDDLDGGGGTDTLRGNKGWDTLRQSKGGDTMDGGKGRDTYVLDGDERGGVVQLVESPGGSTIAKTDVIDLSATTERTVTVDLESRLEQVVSDRLSITLSGAQAFEDVIGGTRDDRLVGNNLPNTFTGGEGRDEFVHHGPGDGIDQVTDFAVTGFDSVKFETGGAVRASQIELDPLRLDLLNGTGSYGFRFVPTLLFDPLPISFGYTDTSPLGSLVGTTNPGPSIGNMFNPADSMIASYAMTGGLLTGGSGSNRLLDYSPGGNVILGRDDTDVLRGGAGDDVLDGDRGGTGANDFLEGGPGADTFTFGESAGATLMTFGDDIVVDMDNDDTIDLFTGLMIKSGLGTPIVTIWNGSTDYGRIGASNGRNWTFSDFS